MLPAKRSGRWLARKECLLGICLRCLGSTMENSKVKIAKAAFSTLTAFHPLSGKLLQAVRYKTIHGSLTAGILGFGSRALPRWWPTKMMTRSDISIAELGPDASDLIIDASRTEPWAGLLAKPFFWGWIALNQQGYLDGILIIFDGVIPQVLRTVAASSNKVCNRWRGSAQLFLEV